MVYSLCNGQENESKQILSYFNLQCNTLNGGPSDRPLTYCIVLYFCGALFWQFPNKNTFGGFYLANLQPRVIEHAQNTAKWRNLFCRFHN